MHISDDLIHFPKLDPSPIGEKTEERSKLQQDIEAFLAGGGEIIKIDTTVCVHYPMRRTRTAQINFLRDRAFARYEMRTRPKK